MTQGVEHIVTEENKITVRELHAYGAPKEHIMKRLDISEHTLNKYYQNEMLHLDKLNSEMGKCLYQKGIEGDVRAMEFWLKCRARWSYAKNEDELDGKEKTNSLLQQVVDKL